jgi:hypothetical protein
MHTSPDEQNGAMVVPPESEAAERGEIRLYCITDIDDCGDANLSIAVVCPSTKLFAFGQSKQAALDAWMTSAAGRFPQLSERRVVLDTSPIAVRSYKVWLGDSEVGNVVYIFDLAVEVVFFAPVSRQIATSRDRRWQLLASVDDVDGDELSLPDFVFEDKLDAIHVPLSMAINVD